MSEEKLVCPICGKPTYLVYGKNPRRDRLCKSCSNDLFSKKIYQCPDCGKWNKTGEDCECKKPVEKYTYLPYSGFEKCVLCGKESLGYAYCRSCWSNYSNEGLLAYLNDRTVDISKYAFDNEEENDTEDKSTESSHPVETSNINIKEVAADSVKTNNNENFYF